MGQYNFKGTINCLLITHSIPFKGTNMKLALKKGTFYETMIRDAPPVSFPQHFATFFSHVQTNFALKINKKHEQDNVAWTRLWEEKVKKKISPQYFLKFLVFCLDTQL